MIFVSARQHIMSVSDNSLVRKIISSLTSFGMNMQGHCGVFKITLLRRTSSAVLKLFTSDVEMPRRHCRNS